MFKEQYRQLNMQVTPDKTLIQKTTEKTRCYEENHNSKSCLLRRSIIVFASICLCFTLTFPVLAAKSESFYQILYTISPATAQFFMPVQKSCVDNKIKMEVISAHIHEDTAEIYIILQDLTTNRVDETTDLFDSYTINRPFDSSAHCERVDYNPAEKTAIFLITIDEWGNKDIRGDKLTFTVHEFLSHKTHYDDISIPVELSTITTASNTQTISSSGGGGSDYEEFLAFESNPTALIPSKPLDEFAVKGMDLTGIGYIDGKLHIQTAVKNGLDNDNHGSFYLKDSKGNKTECSFSFNFTEQIHRQEQINYCEYVFNVPEEQLTGYTLHGSFVTSGMKTEGDWSVTFPLEAAD